MKKLLSIFSAFIITAGGASSLASCSTKSKPVGPKIDKDKIAKDWLDSVSPQIFANIFKSVSPYINVLTSDSGDNDAIISDPTTFFQSFNYGTTGLITNTSVETAIFKYFDNYLSKHNQDILDQLDSANNQYYSEFIDPNVSSEFTIDQSLSSIEVVPYYWNPLVSSPQCNVFLDGAASLADWANDYKSHKPINDLYSISIKFSLNANFIGTKGSEQTNIDCSSNAINTVLVSDPNKVLNVYLNEANKTIISTLENNTFSINATDGNFSFEQDKEGVINSLKSTISNYFSGKNININQISVNNLGEWGNLDQNLSKDSWWKSGNYLFNQLTNNSTSMSGQYIQPNQKNLTPDSINAYFANNSNSFTTGYTNQFSAWKEKNKKGQVVPWLPPSPKNLFKINPSVWSSYDKNKTYAIDYGYFTIDSWSIENTKLGQSWKIPYVILTPNTNSQQTALDFYQSKDNDIISLFGGNKDKNGSSLFDNFKFYANNINISFNSILDYIKNKYYYLYWIITKGISAAELNKLEQLSFTTGVNLIEGIDSKGKSATKFQDNTSFANSFSSLFANSGNKNSSVFFGPINSVTGSTEDINYLTPNQNYLLHPLNYLQEILSEKIFQLVGDTNVQNKGPQSGEVASSSITTDLLMNIFEAIYNSKDPNPSHVAAQILNKNLPKFIVSVDGILIDCNPGISFNLGVSLTDK